jgi:signal transduction histidine kinase
VFESITLSVVSAQLYIAGAAGSTLCLAALVSERERFARRLHASRVRLVKVSDTERRRLEQNLHDGAQQRLSALSIRLGMAAEHARDTHEPGAAALEAAEAEVVLAIGELREFAHGIHPAALTDHGLAFAMRGVAVRATLPITLLELPSARFDHTTEATAYYLFVEALANAQKHARASSIRARATTTSRTLELEIVDDGIGGAIECPAGGLTGLRDRVEALGGTFRVDSPSGHGTRIAAVIPATPADS